MQLVEPSTNGEHVQPQFGFHEEEAIVSLALELPEFFSSIIHFVEPDLFSRIETRYVMTWILKVYKQYGVVPTRKILHDKVARHLTVDDPYGAIIEIINRPLNPREAPIIRDMLKEWARYKQYGLLYDDEAIDAYHRRDFTRLDEIVQKASHINDIIHSGFWFYDQFESLLDPEFIVHYPTGWKRLDEILNDGGPSPGEVVIWMAATNVGKSIWLCNNSINSIANNLDTLHITLEMRETKVAKRCLGAMTLINMKEFAKSKDDVRRRVRKMQATNKAQLAIYDLPPGTCSIDDIRGLLATLRRTRGWSPKVLVIDYLELLISRNPYNNRDEYLKQKNVATEVCALAKTENVLIYSATQTNRMGLERNPRADAGADVNDLNKMAESYGKSMPIDYVLSLNQTTQEYHADPPQVRIFVAKNREGRKFDLINATVTYGNMKVRERAL